MKKSRFFLILILILGLWGIRNLFGGVFYTNHDGYNHTVRIYQYATALSDGQFPPRWAGTLNSGFGSPIFVFSYPLPYVFGSAIYLLGFSLPSAFKLIVGGSFLLSGIFMFLFLKELFSDKGAFLGSIFYILAPYRFLDIYVRGSLSENFAYAVVPIVFFSFIKLWKTRSSKWIALASIALSVLLLSQYLVAAIFLPVLFVLIIILFFNNRSLFFLKSSISVLVLGFGLSAFMYLPILFELKNLHFSGLISFYGDHFVNFFQLIRSPWGYGFSFSGPNDSMSFQIGVIHLFVMMISIFYFFIYLKKAGKSKKEKLDFSLLLFSYLFFVISVFLMIETPVTRYVWKVFSIGSIIDIPWRFLGLSVFTASIIAAFIGQQMKHTILFGALVVLVIYANRNHIRVNQYVDYPDEEFIQYEGTATWMNEYTPIWRGSITFHEPESRYVIDDNIEIKEIESKSNIFTFEAKADKKSKVRLNILYFPGWEFFRDGRKLKKDTDYFITTIDDVRIDGLDESGLIDINIPEGEYRITAQFTETPLRKIGNGISLVSLMTLGLVPIISKKRKKK